MKKKILFLTTIMFSLTVMAQVGVNTENPQGIFHIDGKSDTNGNTNISDDVVVDNQGRIGVGTNAPTTKVDIRSSAVGRGLRLQDGTENIGKVLTSDASGNATWQVNVGNQNSLYQEFRVSTASNVTLESGVVYAFPGIGNYTALNTGKYQVFYHSFLHVPPTSNAGMKSFYFIINNNGTQIVRDETYSYVEPNYHFNTHYSTVVSLNAGDVMSFGIQVLVGAPLTIINTLAYRNVIEVIFLGI
ncbi:hypothetical protein [Dysgonomonas sp. 520]|uniref:hypothetical protein n=1 Tax=Dysgonomonas sp. 520 TaxID=2302931 RepID=UPI0013D84ED9|nr:hypothetical protein [Dysgonomonas sp. 520]NDW09451.1 hypothetical protein [Dysgonomonas sp. 520]